MLQHFPKKGRFHRLAQPRNMFALFRSRALKISNDENLVVVIYRGGKFAMIAPIQVRGPGSGGRPLSKNLIFRAACGPQFRSERRGPGADRGSPLSEFPETFANSVLGP